jgi:hypothetical protein
MQIPLSTESNVTNFAKTCREDDNLEQFSHLLEKCINSWALNNIYIVPLPFNFHGDHIIALRYKLAENTRHGKERISLHENQFEMYTL